VTPELLRLVGEALYGERWQTPLSRALGVGDRTVRRWASGEDKPKPAIAAELAEVMRARRDKITEALEALRRGQP
jgi:hypothetical protein